MVGADLAAGEKRTELGGGGSQLAGYVDEVARSCSGAADGGAGGSGAEEDDVGEDVVGGGLGGVASGEGYFDFLGEGLEAC